MSILTSACLSAACLSAVLAGPCVGVAGVAEQPAAEPAAASPAMDARRLLDELQGADADLTLLSAKIAYDRTFAIQGDRQLRRGELVFESEPGRDGSPRSRRFAIRFDELVAGRRVERDEQLYIFDGQWLVEKIAGEKLVIRRQIVPPGETFDPLRIGEGPFPIPIGQRTDEILARFDAEVTPINEGLVPEEASDEDVAAALRLLQFVAGATQLRLTPRAGGGREEFQEVRLWYRREGDRWLPRMARTINRAGDVSVVQLIQVKVNGEARVAAWASEAAVPDGWEEQVIPWREAADTDTGNGGPK